jgi:NADP-dependent 3-hydroxy acid dehydrogenase YdfG
MAAMTPDDPVLLITGASSGIGAASARAAAGGHRLVLAARRLDQLEELAAELGGDERAIAVRCDVAEWDQVEGLAGAGRGFLEESVEHWRSMVLTNVYGTALTIRATLPHLLERGDGHYLITSSVAGRRALPGSLYSATKFATTAIGEALRAELRQMHDNTTIGVTLIEPGMTDTPFFDTSPGESALRDSDIARVVMFALEQGPGVDVNEILIRPTGQPS